MTLFCEGTRFTETKHEESMKVAASKGLPLLKHHLLPRTKAFSLVAKTGANKSNLYKATLIFLRLFIVENFLKS